MKEGECGYKIIAFVNGKREDIVCNSETGCLRELVWNGDGVRMDAIKVLSRMGEVINPDKIEAYVEGKCLTVKSN
jgi:hypothetical protein